MKRRVFEYLIREFWKIFYFWTNGDVNILYLSMEIVDVILGDSLSPDLKVTLRWEVWHPKLSAHRQTETSPWPYRRCHEGDVGNGDTSLSGKERNVLPPNPLFLPSRFSSVVLLEGSINSLFMYPNEGVNFGYFSGELSLSTKESGNRFFDELWTELFRSLFLTDNPIQFWPQDTRVEFHCGVVSFAKGSFSVLSRCHYFS